MFVSVFDFYTLGKAAFLVLLIALRAGFLSLRLNPS